MLDPALANEPSSALRRQKVKTYVLAWLKAGTFNYTEVLSAQEPLRSDMLEVLDGVIVSANRAGSGEKIYGHGDVVLVHVNPPGTRDDKAALVDSIKCPITSTEEVPGTDRVTQVETTQSFGNFANVPDLYPDRLARNVLVRDGWPIRQSRPGASVIGTVVEWRWLKQAAASDTASKSVRSLYEEIRTRPGFLAFVGEAEPEPTKKSKQPEPARAGV